MAKKRKKKKGRLDRFGSIGEDAAKKDLRMIEKLNPVESAERRKKLGLK